MDSRLAKRFEHAKNTLAAMTSTSAEKDGIFSDDLNAAVIFCRSWPLEFFIGSLSETCQQKSLEEEQKKEQANFVQTLMLERPYGK